MKSHRQSIIRQLVDRESITSQEQLRTRLLDRGIDVTQATLSRDIRELGLVKRTADGAYRSLGTVASGNSAEAETVLAARSSLAIELYQSMDMTFWLPQTEAALARVEER